MTLTIDVSELTINSVARIKIDVKVLGFFVIGVFVGFNSIAVSKVGLKVEFNLMISNEIPRSSL